VLLDRDQYDNFTALCRDLAQVMLGSVVIPLFIDTLHIFAALLGLATACGFIILSFIPHRRLP
jgi:hypothetical protein